MKILERLVTWPVVQLVSRANGEPVPAGIAGAVAPAGRVIVRVKPFPTGAPWLSGDAGAVGCSVTVVMRVV